MNKISTLVATLLLSSTVNAGWTVSSDCKFMTSVRGYYNAEDYIVVFNDGEIVWRSKTLRGQEGFYSFSVNGRIVDMQARYVETILSFRTKYWEGNRYLFQQFNRSNYVTFSFDTSVRHFPTAGYKEAWKKLKICTIK